MGVISALYQLFIGPLELFFETVYALAYRMTSDYGVSIIFLSLAMNFMVLPLYKRADAMQAEERDRALMMKPWVDHIKKTFSGDERFMMLQTYYRQVGYKQTDALKGSVSLLLEIPFFIAAYHFLSHLEALRGIPFGPISDLGAPDAMIQLGAVSINFLPLLMTALNVVSAVIYLKGFPLKSKVQTYGIAVIFLVLLYNSPAGLVFYWTLNNLFSLIKNVFTRLKNPKLVLDMIFSAAGLFGLVYLLFVNPGQMKSEQALLIVCCLLLQLPLVAYAVRAKGKLQGLFASDAPQGGKAASDTDDMRKTVLSFTLACLFLTLLTGLLIPSAVISASPEEFVVTSNEAAPLCYLVDSALLAAGVFLIWFGIFYRLATDAGKRAFALVAWIAVGCAVVDYLLFGTGYGTISSVLQFDKKPDFALSWMAINAVVLIAVAGVFYAIWRWRRQAVRIVSVSACIVVIVMSVMNIMQITQTCGSASVETLTEQQPRFSLSKTGKNVVVLMMDRAASCYLPVLINEKPELKEALDGFVYYPNTLSYATATNYGTPGLYGGYEYIPEAMNARKDMSLAEKHNEALKVMPVMFEKEGYDVTVCDPTFAGYKWLPDLSVYADYPDIHTYITNGSFEVAGLEEYSRTAQEERSRHRNFFYYALFKTAPLIAQPTLYNGGDYNAANASGTVQTWNGISKGAGLRGSFMNAYAVLCNLKQMTDVTDNGTGSFVMMSNDTTHAPALLQEPAYTPALNVDNTTYDAAHKQRTDANGKAAIIEDENQMTHYHVNMAALLKLGEWFDYLREMGVYDNTRIIIVSDHAWGLGQQKDLIQEIDTSQSEGDSPVDLTSFNCMLLVKDFDSHGFSTKRELMTNADTPLLAVDGVIDKPTNPFTGKKVERVEKTGKEHHVVVVKYYNPLGNNGNVFKPGDWFSVHDDVFKADNWKYLGFY